MSLNEKNMYVIPERLQDEAYSFVRVYLPQMAEEYEVTYEAMCNLNRYPIFNNWYVKSRDNKYTGYCLSRNDGLDISSDCMTSYFGAYGPVLDYIEKNDDDDIEHLLGLYRYIYHTIGNFIPLPEGCNAQTWGNDNYSYKLHEISILFKLFEGQKIKESVITKSNRKAFSTISKMLPLDKTIPSGGREKVAYWIKKDWIDQKKGWNDFYNELFFQDYVDDSGEVVSFYEGQRFISKKMKDTKGVKNSINNTVDLIIKRGYRIKNKIKSPQLCSKDLMEISKIKLILHELSFDKALI